MSDYVCTYTVDRHRCGRPGTWNGRAFRCEHHRKPQAPAPKPDKIGT